MEDVKLLVKYFYQFGEKYRKILEYEREKRLDAKKAEDELNVSSQFLQYLKIPRSRVRTKMNKAITLHLNSIRYQTGR